MLSFQCQEGLVVSPRKAPQHYVLTDFILVSSTGYSALPLDWALDAHDQLKLHVMRKYESIPRYCPFHLRLLLPALPTSIKFLCSVQGFGESALSLPPCMTPGFIPPPIMDHPLSHGFFCFHPFPSLSSILHYSVSLHLSPNIIFPALWRTHYQ